MSDSVLFLLLAFGLMVVGGGLVYLQARGPRSANRRTSTDDLRSSLDALSSTRNTKRR